jgi:uncharacterized protein (DUF885 family)
MTSPAAPIRSSRVLRTGRSLAVLIAVLMLVDGSHVAGARSPSAAFADLVDQYLDGFARRHPSIAAGNGLHQADGSLEDFRREQIAAEIAWFRSERTKVDAVDVASLLPDERVDHRILQGLIDAWLLDLDQVENWRRNPMIYASAVLDGVHNLMTMESSPAGERYRMVVAKLRGVPALAQAARANIANPPRIFAERGVVMSRAAASLIEHELPMVLPPPASGSSVDAAVMKEATSALRAYADELERNVVPQSAGQFAIGREHLEARYRAEELIDLSADQLRAIGQRELDRVEGEFQATSKKISADRPVSVVWQDILADHPRRGELADAAQKAVDGLLDFIRAAKLVTVPSDERVLVKAAPEFDLGLASMHSSPPLEKVPVKSYYYVTDARADWPPERQEAWLRKFNYASLTVISAHEVYPGHYLHSLFMRRTPGKIRRIWIGLNPFPQPSSGQDGWAHYAEQMIFDEGYRVDEPKYRMAQLSEALVRLARLIAGINLHTGQWSVDEAARFFEERGHLPAPAARQEAERGTYDPTYGGYALGKIAAFKLRRDVQQADPAHFNLREFHERVMTNGIAPWWAHRALLLPGTTGAVIE